MHGRDGTPPQRPPNDERSGASALSPVIRRKLRPPQLAEWLVPRPHLEQRLSGLIARCRVVVVVATAGSGKTTATVRATDDGGLRTAWLSVDRTDSAPGRFVAYLEATLARQLPGVEGVATSALAAGLPHPEAAGLLAEAVTDEPTVLVLDDLERLDDVYGAWAVLEALVRYASDSLHIVLLSRHEIPAPVLAAALEGSTAFVGEPDLAFTVDEAATVLARLGTDQIDPTLAVRATGGWVTGVLFEAWRSVDHPAGVGGEADPLHGYLAVQILDQLSSAERSFLIDVSLLEEITVGRAEALGHVDAGQRLTALRAVHLPVTWQPDGRTMRFHPRFREYLLERLERLDSGHVRQLKLRLGRLLAAEGQHDEATDRLIEAGALDEAARCAEHAIMSVIERLDFSIAERWIGALGDFVDRGASPLVTAELMLAVTSEDYARGARLADELAEAGVRERLARATPRAAGLMAWCYLHLGRLDQVHVILDDASDEPVIQAVRYAMGLLEDAEVGGPPSAATHTGEAVEALPLRTYYHFGRFSELLRPPASRWVGALTGPFRIAALRASGRISEALELYKTAKAAGVAAVGLHALIGPEVLLDAGLRDEVYAALERGREVARMSGSLVFELLNSLLYAKAALRLDRDPAAACAALDRLEEAHQARRFSHVREMLDTWYGAALLLQGDHERARERLANAVTSMVRGDRILELPTAAVYLAEAQWRCQDEVAADRAADLALDTARRQGANHLLLQALAEFPDVVSRRIDAEATDESDWHALGRALRDLGMISADLLVGSAGPEVRLAEFGRLEIELDEVPVHPRIAKSYELLAYLATRPRRGAGRDELLQTIFDGRTDQSTRAYLRQAIHQLRHVLPDGAVSVDRGRVALAPEVRLHSESVRFLRALAEAARLHGEERLRATHAAFAIAEGGEYLPNVRTRWAEERRAELHEQATQARGEAAELEFTFGRFDIARQLCEAVQRDAPYRESTWRLSMRLANALGDSDGVIMAYRACEKALASLGAAPAPATQRLLTHLRP